MSKKIEWIVIRNVAFKTLIFFILLNLVFAVAYPLELLGAMSGYNWIFPGRVRLPHSDVPEKAFNVTTSNVEAMYRSHEISRQKADEFRIVIIGDSSVWGFLLEADQTFTSKLNQMNLEGPGGSRVRFYNLGYPTLSVTKDLMLLDRAMDYHPNMILWFVTLESLVENTQLESPLLLQNPNLIEDMLEKYDLTFEEDVAELDHKTFFDKTIVGSRVELSELLRLQLYGFAWAATGVDHYIPESYNQRMEDLSEEIEYKGFHPGELTQGEIYFEAIEAGIDSADNLPVIVINEPIFISSGANSDVRYNFFYPRWAYDRYRSILLERADQSKWLFTDLWNVIPPSEFTDSAIHYSPNGNSLMADRIASLLQSQFDFSIVSR